MTWTVCSERVFEMEIQENIKEISDSSVETLAIECYTELLCSECIEVTILLIIIVTATMY